MKNIPQSEWPNDGETTRIAVYKNREHLVQCFQESGAIRLSINSVRRKPDGQWKDRITWDELQRIKRLIGYGDLAAIEIYPRDKDIVNVANMRHLWIPDNPITIGWFRD